MKRIIKYIIKLFPILLLLLLICAPSFSGGFVDELSKLFKVQQKNMIARKSGVTIGGGKYPITFTGPMTPTTIGTQADPVDSAFIDRIVADSIDAPVGRSATLVVAANNSSVLSKSQADYVCNGTDDQEDIQEAVDALPVDGGRIMLSEGTFLLSSSIFLEDRDNVEIIGAGSNSILKHRNQIVVNITEDANIGTHTIVVDDVSEWELGYHFAVRDDAGEQSQNYCITSIDGNTLTFSIKYRLEDPDGGGLAAGVTVINNPQAMLSFPLIFVLETCNHISVKNLTGDLNKANYTDWTSEPCNYEQFFNNSGTSNTYIRIEDCHIHDSYGCAIDFHGSDYSIVKNNFVTGCAWAIHNEVVPEFQLIEGNNFYGGGIYSDYVKNIQVVNNYILNASSHGIYLSNIPNHARVIISGNMIVDANNLSLYVGGQSIATVEGVIIESNFVHESVNQYGIYVRDVDDLIITNNVVYRNAQVGIRIRECKNASIINNIVDDNNVEDGGGAGMGDGIWISNGNEKVLVSNNKIHNSSVTGHQRYGVRIDGSCSDVTIINNTFNNNETGAIMDATGRAMIYDQYSNHFQDCIVSAVAHIHAAIVGTGAEQEIIAGITNPDVPKNSSITSSNVGPPSGDVIIEGIDAKGNSVNDTLIINAGGITYGDVAFSTVSKIIIPATVLAGDNIQVGISDKLGINNVIYATGDVYKVKVNNADKTNEFNMAVDVDTDYGTIDMSSLVAGAIGAGDDITIWFRSNLNIIE